MTRRRNIDEELKISYTKMALNWCVENLGVNRRKRKKLILEINDKDFSQSRIIYYGKYCFNQNKIVIYISSCETIDDLISTTIEFSLSILFHMLLLFSKSMRKTGEKKRGKIH